MDMATRDEKKKIVIIGTGGTIAGQSASDADLTGYQAGAIGVDDLLSSVPELGDYGPLESKQLCNIDSSDMTTDLWLSLSRLVQKEVAREDVAGVVITHGTDTMEESAYFLHLTVSTDKPIVVTGSMRPASAISADGPLNLLNAVLTARSPEARGKGVIVTLNNYLDCARDVTKQNTTDVATFASPLFGHQGLIQGGQSHWYYVSTRRHTKASEFAPLAADVRALPEVGILYLYGGVSAQYVESIKALPWQGLVIAGLGHGILPTWVEKEVKQLSIPVVRASRVAGGMVSALPDDGINQFLTADTLNLAKARILLMLGLAKGYGDKELQDAFNHY